MTNKELMYECMKRERFDIVADLVNRADEIMSDVTIRHMIELCVNERMANDAQERTYILAGIPVEVQRCDWFSLYSTLSLLLIFGRYTPQDEF